MSDSPQLELEIILDDGSVKKAFASVKSQSQAGGSAAGKAFQRGFGISGGLKNSLSSIRTQLLAVGTAYLATFASRKVIDLAKEQEQAVADFNTSLKLSGKFTADASKSFQQYASSLQNSSVVGDEVILKNAALIQNLGKLEDEGLRRATKASLDLSAALGIDLAAASTLVGKAASGEVGSFSRYGISIKKAGTNAETFDRVLTKLETSFGGAAAAKTQTYTGAIEQLGNTFGDLLESVGNFVVKNPLAVAFAKVKVEDFNKQIEFLNKNLEGPGIDNFNNKLIEFGLYINRFVIVPLESVLDVGSFVFKALTVGINTAVLGLAGLAGGIDKILSFAGIDTGLTAQIDSFTSASLEALQETSREAKEAFSNIITSENTGIESTIRRVQEKLDELNAKAAAAPGGSTGSIAPAPLEASSASFDDFFNNLSSGFNQAQRDSKKFGETVKKLGSETKKSLINGIGAGAGNAFAAFGAAIVNGENALEAFTKALIKSIGQQAVQLGTKFILEGTAYLFAPGYQAFGPPLIAAGAGLAAFGGAVSALSGSSTPSTSPGGSDGTQSGGVFNDTSFNDDIAIEDEEPATNVTVVNNGPIYDQQKFGLDLVTILEELELSQNIKILGRA